MHIFRWDLDRTYLDTDIFSVRGMLRAAVESPESKRNIPGADVLLRALLRQDPEDRATILSGSPTQMRAALEQKLTLDGIRFDSLVLKDNLRNLRKGRLRALKGQLGYKLPRLLELRLGDPVDSTESLFGDDAEVDAVIYALYADVLAGEVTRGALIDVMKAGGAYPDQIDDALGSVDRLTRRDAVTDIWIHVDRGIPLTHFAMLGPRVRVVFSWFQAALGLWSRGRLTDDDVTAVAHRVAQTGGYGVLAVSSWAQDAVRRGLAPGPQVRSLLARTGDLQGLAPHAVAAIDRLGNWSGASTQPPQRDYIGFLRASETFV